MKTKQVSIWIWIQSDHILKAIICYEDGTLKIYDEYDNLIMKRVGLNRFQLKQVEDNFVKFGAKRLGQHDGPFKFL